MDYAAVFESRHNHDRLLGVYAAQLEETFEARDTRHREIEKHQIEAFAAAHHFLGRFDGGRFLDRCGGMRRLNGQGERVAEQGVVVHHQEAFVHRLGPQDFCPPRTGAAYRSLVWST